MKTIRPHSVLIPVCFVFLSLSLPAYTQHPCEGDWEGMFMDDFRTLIRLTCSGGDSLSGKIMMWDGSQQIQEDEIFKIVVEDHSLSFYIMAKETRYEGVFNEGFTELSGHFVFPDGSLHSLESVRLEAEKNM